MAAKIFEDPFNRPDSTSGLGNGWATNYNGVWGIAGGKAYAYSGDINNGRAIVTGRNLGIGAHEIDLTIDVSVLATSGSRAGIIFGWDGGQGGTATSNGGASDGSRPGGTGYILKLGDAYSTYLSRFDYYGIDQDAPSPVVGGIGSTGLGFTPGASPTTIRITFSKTTGVIKIYYDDALAFTWIDPHPATGTFIGLQSDSSATAASYPSYYRFDNLSVLYLVPDNFLHFEIRADTGSGNATSAEVFQVSKNNSKTSLGTFVSDSAPASGDAPWTEFEVEIADDSIRFLDRIEISKFNDTTNYAPTSGWYGFGPDSVDLEFPAIRGTSTSGTGNWGQNLPGLTPGKVYRASCWLKFVPGSDNTVSIAEFLHQSSTTSETMVTINPMSTTTYILAEATFVATGVGDYLRWAISAGGSGFSVLIKDWSVHDATLVSEDNAHIRNVWIESEITLPNIIEPANRWYHYNYGERPLETQPGPVWRTSSTWSARVNTDTGGATTRLSVPFQVGHRYAIQVWVKGIAGDGSTTRMTDLEVQDSTGTQHLLIESSPFYANAWRLLSATYDCTVANGDILIQAHAGVYLPGGWHFDLSDWTVFDLTAGSAVNTGTAVVDGEVIKSHDYGAFPRGFPYTADVEDGILGSWYSPVGLPANAPNASTTLYYTITHPSLPNGGSFSLRAHYPSGTPGVVGGQMTFSGTYGTVTDHTITAGITFTSDMGSAAIGSYALVSGSTVINLWLSEQGQVILNDGGTLPGSAYYAEQGQDVDPSPYNYDANFSSQPGGTPINGWQGWSCDPEWHFDGSGWGVLESHSTGYDGLFNTHGHSLVLRSDGLHSAPKHHIEVYLSYYGSRGSNGEGAVWGYKDANNYWFAIPNSDSGPGHIGYVSGGVLTNVALLPCDSWVAITVDHNFRSGALTVDTYEPFLGATTHYSGTHPWTVANGKVGFLGKHQGGGSFWTAALIGDFKLIYSLGSIGYNRQYSMADLEVVPQSPLTWYFGSQITPPLRQRHRDDGLGSDTRQEKGYGSSQQMSLRRGGRVYY